MVVLDYSAVECDVTQNYSIIVRRVRSDILALVEVTLR